VSCLTSGTLTGAIGEEEGWGLERPVNIQGTDFWSVRKQSTVPHFSAVSTTLYHLPMSSLPESPYLIPTLPISVSLLPFISLLAAPYFMIFTNHPLLISCAQNHNTRHPFVVLIPHHFYLPDRAMLECQPHLLSHDLDDSWFSITFFVGS